MAMLDEPLAVVLEGVEWSFQRNRYKDVPSFVKGVTQFHTQARGVTPAWQPDAIVVPVETIRIRLAPQLVPSVYGGGLEAHERTDPGNRIFTLRGSRNGFTAAGLLFEAHNLLRAGLEGRPRDTFLHQIVQVKRAELFEPALYEVRTKYWIGAPSEQPKGPLPREVLRSISWSFAECGAIKDEAGFVRRVHGYHDSLLEIMRENDPSATLTGLRPDEIVVPAPIICVSYLARHDDVLLVLHASRPEGFTEAQLLHAIHNDAAPRIGQAHHHFFEGLHDPVESPLLPPCYQMSIGS